MTSTLNCMIIFAYFILAFLFALVSGPVFHLCLIISPFDPLCVFVFIFALYTLVSITPPPFVLICMTLLFIIVCILLYFILVFVLYIICVVFYYKKIIKIKKK